jgi:periplasmic protein TonB
MKLSFFFFLSAAFHGAVFLLPASRTEVGRQRIFPVTITALSEPEPARSPQKEKKLQNMEVRRREPTPRAETIADARSAAAEKIVAAATTATVPSAAQSSEAAAPPDALTAGDIPETQEIAPDTPEKTTPLLPHEQAPPAVEPSAIASVRNVSAAVEKLTPKGTMPVIAEVEDEFQPSFSITKARRNPPPNPILEARVPEKSREAPWDEKPKPVAKSPPRYAHNPPPEYPVSARRVGSEGSVILSVLVDAQGRPEKIEISRSSGIQSLDEAARKSVREWRFHPARNGDTPVPSWVNIPVVFQLAGR